MTGWSDAALLVSRSPELSVLAKATLILIAALAAARLAGRARASARHLVIASTFVALLALPMLIVLAPGLTFDVPLTPAAAAPADAAPSVARPAAPRAAAPASSPATNARAVSWPSIASLARIAWAVGAVVFLLPVVAVLWRLSQIRRTGLPVARYGAELRRLLIERGIASQVELIEHEGVPAPMTFGLKRPVIVLPLDARGWSNAELRRALTHELEHIQRGDWIMQITARVIAACYWFHPLVWTAWRRLCLEAERSCDDAVVMSEERTDYADQLVTLAQRMSATPVQPLLGMANRSDLSTRVSAVLDDRLRRGRAGFALAAGTIAAAVVVVLTVAPVRAVAVTAERTVTAQNTPEQTQLEQARRPSRAAGSRVVRALDRELYEAAERGDIDDINELLEAGANVNARVSGDGSPLIAAARRSRIDVANLLLDRGADPNLGVDGDGNPLIAAANRGNIQMVTLLLDRGANPNVGVEGDGSALIAAASNGHVDIIELLIIRGADIELVVRGDENPLIKACESGQLRSVRALIARGANLNARVWVEASGRDGSQGEWRTPLSMARRNGHNDIVAFLQASGAQQ